MATRLMKTLATATLAAGLVVGAALGGSGSAAWDTVPHDVFATQAVVVAVDVVANYCTPTPCRPPEATPRNGAPSRGD